MNENLNIIQLQREFYDFIEGLGITSNLFLKRPRQVGAKMPDFAVCRVSTNIYDRKAYGDSVVSLDVYVRDLEDGVTVNSDKLSSINSTILAHLPYTTANYHFTFQNSTPTVDDGSGFTYQIFNLRTLIKQN